MYSLNRWIVSLALILAVAACAAPSNRYVTLDEQFCWRHFGKECPSATYNPPPPPQPPAGQPTPDLKLSAISCDDTFGVRYVSAQVSNEGNAPALAAPSGNSVTVTVLATARAGVVDPTLEVTEVTQNSLTGDLAQGQRPQTIRVAVNHAWSDITKVRVSVDTDRLWQERDYSNNGLNADVLGTSTSSGFTKTFCTATRP